MRRALFTSALLVVLVATGKPQTPLETKSPVLPSGPGADDTTPAATPATAAAAKQRAVSPATAARINEKLPKFSPLKSNEQKETSPDLRETDKPRNGVIRLPRYIVREPKQPTFKERDLLTPSAKLDLALKKYPGLKILNFWGLNNGIAMGMQQEDERLEVKAEMEERADLYRYSAKPGETAEVKRATDELFMRHMGPSH